MEVHAGIFKQISLGRRFLQEAETAASLDPNYVEARMGLIEFYLLAPGILGGGKDKAQKNRASGFRYCTRQGKPLPAKHHPAPSAQGS
jgi:hypothetical protein